MATTTAKLSLTSTLPLPNSSLTIPRLGFGVYQSHGPTCIKACLAALKAGYRQIDSAQFYRNESQVADAVSQSGIPRSELFLTTKILSASGDAAKTYESIIDSVRKTSGAPDGDENSYVDLFLIHSPNSGAASRKKMWQALERAHKEGRCKAIGVSNFGKGHIEEMKAYASVWPPQVNQIELHPWCQQRQIVDYCNKHAIVIQAYCPLVRNRKANDPTLNEVANKHGKTTGAVLIRYCLQKGWVPLPKSENEARIQQNADVYGFEIDNDDMKKLDSLDQGSRGALVQAASN